MQINNYQLSSANQLQTLSADATLELKEGEIYKAQIKERLSDNEAVLQIKGKEVTAKFEGTIPGEDRINVQIQGLKDQALIVKAVVADTSNHSNATTQQSDADFLQSIGITTKDQPELIQSVQTLLNKGIPVTRDTVQELRDFFEKAPGTNAAKLDTVKALANKRLEVTQSHLRPIHEALHGKPLHEVLTDLAKEIDPEFDLAKNEQKAAEQRVRQHTEKIDSGAQTSQRAQISGNNDQTRVQTTDKQAVQANTNNEKVQQIIGKGNAEKQNFDKLREAIRDNREFIEKAPDLKQAIEKLRNDLLKNPSLDREMAQKIEKAAMEAEKLQAIGKDRLVQALKTAEDQLVKQEKSSEKVQMDQTQLRNATSVSTEETKPAEIVKGVKEEVSKTPNLQRSIEVVQKQIVENPRFTPEVAKKVQQAVDEAARLLKQGRITPGKETLINALQTIETELEASELVKINQDKQTEITSRQQTRGSEQIQLDRRITEQPASITVRQVREDVQRDPNLLRAVEKVREQVINNPKVDVEVAQKVEKAVNEARQLQQMGRESIGRERLVRALEQAEVELKQIETRQQATQPKVDQAQLQGDRRTTEQQEQVRPERGSTQQPASETVKQVKQEVQRDPNLQRVVDKVREQVVNNPKVDIEVAQKVERAVNEARQLQQMGRESMGHERLARALEQAEVELKQIETRQQPTQPKAEQSQRVQADRPTMEQQAQVKTDRLSTEQPASETVKQVKEEVQRDPNLQRVVDKVREQVVNNPKVDIEIAQKVERAVNEARQLQQMGRESMGRERLVQALEQAEVELKQIETRQQATQPNAEQSQQVQVDRRTTEQQAQVKTDRLSTEQPASETVKQVKQEVQRDPNLQRVVDKVREQVINNPKVDVEVAQKVERAVNEARQLQQMSRESMGRERLAQALEQAEVELKQIETRQQPTQPKAEQSQQLQADRRTTEQQAQVKTDRLSTEKPASETVKQIKEEVRRDPNLQRVVDKVCEQVINNPKVDVEVAQKVERAVNEARQLQQMGRESMGHERLARALEQAEVELKQIETRQQATQPKVDQAQLQADRRTTEQQVRAESDRRPIEQPASETVKQVKEEVQRDPNLQRVVDKVREQIINNPKVDIEVALKVEKAVNEARQLQQMGRESMGHERLARALEQAEVELKQIETRQQAAQSKVDQAQLQADRRTTEQQVRAESDRRPIEQPASETVKQVKEEVQRDPNLQRVVDKVREQVVNNPKVDLEVAQKIEKAVNEARQLQQMGRESMGRERLARALEQAEVELKQIETRQQATPPKVDQAQLQADRRTTEQQVRAESDRRPIEQPSSETVKQVKEEVQRDPNIKQAIEKVRDLITNNKNIDPEIARSIERIANQANQLDQAGRERITKILEQIESTISKAEAQTPRFEQNQNANLNHNNNQNQASNTGQDQIQKQNPNQAQNASKDQTNDQQTKNQAQTQTQTGQLQQSQQTRQTEQTQQSQQSQQTRQTKQTQQSQQSQQTRQTEQTLHSQHSQQTQQAEQPQQSQQTQPKPATSTQQQSSTLTSILEQLTAEQPTKTRPSDIIKDLLKHIQKEPSLENALNHVRKETSSNPNLDIKTIEKVEKAIEKASQLQEKGRELGARQHIKNTLTEIEQELAKVEPKQVNQPNDQQKAIQDTINQFELNEELQTMPLQSKEILVTRVTQKLAQATHDFRELKREITRNLDNVERLVNTFKNSAYPQAKQILETTISKLDNAILKSEMMLFTDMKTEKQLMQASTQLADAKKLLAKGNHSEAAKIVHEVKTLIDKINFKPSEQKVMHFVSKESMNLEPKSPTQQLLNHFDETARSYVRQEPSARQMFEMVRSLGLNHDSDLAKSLVFQKGGDSSHYNPNQQGQQDQQQQQQNLKATLMKLAQTGGDETTAKIAQHAEQALNNLTGQQLLSKTDSGNTSLQSMFFNLPVLLGEKPQNLQVFVNSKNEGQQVDWENCNLYFLIETKKLGDVGIMLASTDRNLSITIKNDKIGFKSKMEPIAAITKEKLQEIGYNVNSINFTRMTPMNSQSSNSQKGQPSDHQQVRPSRPVFTEKGMDFKI